MPPNRETPSKPASKSERSLKGPRTDGAADEERGKMLSWLLLHCLGFGACWGWVHVAFFSTALWGPGGEDLSTKAWAVNAFANGCAMIAFGILSLKLAPLTRHHWLVLTAVLLASGGTLGISFGQAAGNILVYAGAVSSGAGTAGLLLLWAEAYRSIPVDEARKYTIPWSMAVGVLYYLAIGMLPPSLAVLSIVVLPALSAALLLQSNQLQGGLEQSSQEDGAKPVHHISLRYSLPLRFIAIVALYSVPTGLLRSSPGALSFISADGTGETIFAFAALITAVVSVASTLLADRRKVELIYRSIMPLMAAGLLMLPFLTPGQGVVAGACIMSAFILFQMYVWASLSDIATDVAAPSAFVFGVGESGINVGVLAGILFGLLLNSGSPTLFAVTALALVYLFLVFENFKGAEEGTSLLLPVSAYKGEQERPGSTRQKMTIAEAAKMDLASLFSAVLKDRCESVSRAYGLSAREKEVLELLAKGRSLQSIADALGVAYTTVKTHTDHIYTKTGVHSRQELIDLLEQSD